MKKLTGMLLALLLVCGAPPLSAAESGAFDAGNFSATLTMTTDYVSRGVSATDGEPAVQGSFDYAHPQGFYLGIWASNWEDPDPTGSNIELDYYIGYAGGMGAFSYDVSAYYYDFVDANDDGAEYNYFEFIAFLKYGLDASFSPEFGVGYAFSPEYGGEDGKCHYVNGTLDLMLPANLVLGFELGYQDVEGDKSTGGGAGLDNGDGFDYVHWRVSLSKELKGFMLDLSYHDTSESDWLSSNVGKADERLVFSVSRSF